MTMSMSQWICLKLLLVIIVCVGIVLLVSFPSLEGELNKELLEQIFPSL